MQNDETEQETDLDTTVEETEEDTQNEEATEVADEQGVEYWKAEALKNKAILDRQKNKPKEKTKKTDDFGYDVKAYLKASNIKDSEFDFVRQEMKQFNGDLDSLLSNEYFQAKLEKQREISKTEDATPKGTRSGQPATDSVEYWLSKPIEDVPADMRIKVVNAKLDKESSKGAFYNS